MKTKWFSKPKEMSKPIKHLAAAALMTTLLFGVAPPMAWCSTPDWLRSAALAPLPKYPDDTRAVLLLNEQVTTVGNNSEIKTRYRRAYRILRPEGRSFGTASAYFDSETRLTYFKAWCIPP